MKNFFKFYAVLIPLLLIGIFFVAQGVKADTGGGSGGGAGATICSQPVDYQTITLNPGWNIISTPKVLSSHSFSAPETTDNFDIYLLDPISPSGWQTMQGVGQTEFQPLFAYFINNKTGQNQTLRLNYNFDLTPAQRLFQRTLQPGWNAVGIALPDETLQWGAENIYSDDVAKILNQINQSTLLTVDFTADQNDLSSVKIGTIWKVRTNLGPNDLSSLRNLKGYGVYITQPTSAYIGFENLSSPCRYTLTYTAGANGSIAGTSPQTVFFGLSGTAITAVPATDYRFINWSDGSTANPRTDTNIVSNINVTANFITSILGAIDVDVVNLRTTTASVDIGDTDQLLTKFKFTETTSNEDVYLEELTVYNDGNAADGDVINWTLKDPDGNTLATVAQSDDKYVTFDLTNSPGYLIPDGSSKTLSVYVDIVSGANRTTQAVILNDYDVIVRGKDSGASILVTTIGNTIDISFPIGDIVSGSVGYNHITAAAGSLTVTLSNTSPTGTLPAGGSEVVFAKFDLKAKGEDIEVRRLEFYLIARTAPDNGDSGTTANESDDIFAGTIVLKTSDGTSRYALTVASDAPSTTATAYTLSSYFTIPSGTTETISIVGNLRSDISLTDSFQFAIKNVYVKQLTTGYYNTYATSAINANTLTGPAGSLTVVKDASWGNKSIIAGAAKQVGQFVLQTGSSEGVYISTFNVDLSSITGVNELWMQKGAGTCSETSSTLIGSVDTSVAGTNDSFSTGGVFTIPASSSQVVIVCTNFDQNTATGTYITDFDADDITGTGAISGEAMSNTAAAVGQIMTVQRAGILTAKIGSNPNAAVLRSNETGVKVLDITFGTLYEPITIDTFRFTVETGGDQDRDFTNYTLKHGSASIGSGKSAVSGVITFSGLTETIPYYGSENYSLWIDVSDALTIGSADKARAKYASVEATGDWSSTAIMASHDTGYCGAITTEPGSTSSVGHYKAGDLVVSLDNAELQPVISATNEAVDLTLVGLDIGGSSNETFTTSEEISKFGAIAQAYNSGASTTGIAVNDYVVVHDASANDVYAGIVSAVVAGTSITVMDLTGSTAVILAAGDINVELSGTGYALGNTGPAAGDFIGYYDVTAAVTYTGVVTAVTLSTGGGATTFDATDSVTVNNTAITVASGDIFFAFDSDISQEVYSTQSTYQYGVGDVVYHYDNGGTSGWAVVTTGIDAGETMANLVTSDSTAAASDRIVRFSPGVIASNNMTMHDVEPILTASNSTYSTAISGSMQTIAIYDITAVGGALSVESLAITLEGSGVGQLSTATNAWEIWEGGERIYQGGDVSGGTAATYACDLTTPEQIASGQTKTFTIKLNTTGTWGATQVGMSLRVKVNGTKGQMASGLDWYYTSSGPGTAPTASSPASISDSEFPVYGKYSLTY